VYSPWYHLIITLIISWHVTNTTLGV